MALLVMHDWDNLNFCRGNLLLESYRLAAIYLHWNLWKSNHQKQIRTGIVTSTGSIRTSSSVLCIVSIKRGSEFTTRIYSGGGRHFRKAKVMKRSNFDQASEESSYIGLVVVMSFLKPDAIAKFKSVQSFLLWFQLAYSIWQFIRTAKFFRLPYVMLSSSWNGFDSWYKTRKLILMRDELGVDRDPISDQGLQSLSSPRPGVTIEEVGDYNVQVSFTNLQTPYTCLTSKHRARHMVMLQEFRRLVQFGRDDDLLWPKVHLIRRLSFENAVSHVLSGKGYSAIEPQMVCFFDYSARELLNQNFVRFASIWPLILQARHFDFWSIVFSLFVILMDVFSYGANKLWEFVQYWVSRLVKVVILQFSNRKTRVFLFTFMGSISTKFLCNNFVTEEASFKVVKRVLLATHIKFDKRKVATLDPILNTNVEVPRKEGNHEVKQTISFKMAGVRYSARIQPRLSEQWRSSVHFIEHSIKVKDWAIEDMAYFLQVCYHCKEFKFSPIKELDERNTAMCSSFAEIVHGVKTRNFVLCEFKSSQRLFFT